ncbi:MAG: FGGY-family carbohydrate kinase [Oscillospiraceae bacterium]|nr:FGGY-family carbohydrate kinase [Oscillospiraceae bacterium]
MLILALESSTSSAKALLFDPENGVVDTADAPYDDNGLILEQGVTDTDGVFRLTASLGKRLAEGKTVDAVALCGTFHSMAVCGGAMDGGKTYAWNYMAPSALCARARADAALVDRLYNATGCMPHVTYMRQTMRYLRENGLDLSDKLLPSQGAYNFYKLTGAFCESVSTASGFGLLNIHTLDYDADALAYAGVRRGQLGALVTYKDTRPLSDAGAKLLGIRSGVPVVAAHPDGALNQIANGAAVVGRMTLSIGTSGAIRLTSDHPILPENKDLWCYYGVTDWLSGAAISSACNCINWFKETCLGDRYSFKELEREEDVGQPIPVFLPFVFGERCPGWRDDRLGGFMEVTPAHTAVELHRALQAGILFNLYQCYEVLCRDVGAPDRIIVSGGVLNSKQWTQMIADIFRHELTLVKNINASSVGAAVLGAHAAGALGDVTAYTAEIDGARTVAPRAELADYYAQQYRRYLRWYALTKAV